MDEPPYSHAPVPRRMTAEAQLELAARLGAGHRLASTHTAAARRELRRVAACWGWHHKHKDKRALYTKIWSYTSTVCLWVPTQEVWCEQLTASSFAPWATSLVRA